MVITFIIRSELTIVEKMIYKSVPDNENPSEEIITKIKRLKASEIRKIIRNRVFINLLEFTWIKFSELFWLLGSPRLCRRFGALLFSSHLRNHHLHHKPIQ